MKKSILFVFFLAFSPYCASQALNCGPHGDGNCIGREDGLCVLIYVEHTDPNSATDETILFTEEFSLGGWVEINNPDCNDFEADGGTTSFFIPNETGLE